VGFASSVRAFGLRPSRPIPVLVLAPLSVAILWLANRALEAPSAYDLGLYHAAAVEYASNYAAIPGLGNLHDRLAAGDAHFLLTALLGNLPWVGSGFRLPNGLLVAMLLADVGFRVGGRARDREFSFALRMALVSIPAVVLTVAIDPSRLTEPDLDLSAFVLVVVGAVYLAEAVEGRFEPAAAATSLAAFALASVNRPLFWLMTGIAGVVLAGHARPRARGLLAAAIGPAALGLGWAARQGVLSGYPLFPLTIVRLPVDWRMPPASVDELDRWIRSWSRSHGGDPGDVLGSWAWLGPWLRRELTTYDVLVPLLLLVAAVLALLLRSPTARRAQAPLLAIVAPSVLTLAAWFLVAPDPRFALGPIWLVPIALAASALPESRSAAVSPRALLGSAAIVVALGVGLVHIAGKRTFIPIAARAEAATPPSVVPFRAMSGLVLRRPVTGSDQCWSVMLCTPAPEATLRLRGATVQSGFRLDARPCCLIDKRFTSFPQGRGRDTRGLVSGPGVRATRSPRSSSATSTRRASCRRPSRRRSRTCRRRHPSSIRASHRAGSRTRATRRGCSSAIAGSTRRESSRSSRSVTGSRTRPSATRAFRRRVNGRSATVAFTIKNTGSRAGAEVGELYVGFPSSTGEPPQQLRRCTPSRDSRSG
jgi:hypothetical protein